MMENILRNILRYIWPFSRADFWISQPRKFCEFCKCWIADNKPSRDFHERGKKHQENVKHKISQVMKKGVTDAKKESEMSATLKRMEQAAMKALKKDVARDPSLASQYGVKIKGDEPSPKPEMGPAPRPVPESSSRTAPPKASKNTAPPKASSTTAHPKTSSNTAPPKASSTTAAPPETPETGEEKPAAEDPNEVWKEEWTPEGFVYYWHILTGESKWVKPEGYTPTWERAVNESGEDAGAAAVELASREEEDGDEEDTGDEEKDETVGKSATSSDSDTSPADNEDTEDRTTNLPDDKEPPVSTEEVSLQDIALPSDIPLPPVVQPTIQRPPRPQKPSAYGSWETVQEQVEQPQPDLQLPVDKHIASAEVKTIVVTEPKIKFRTKKVDTLGAEFVAFKKRKLNSAKGSRNIRTTDTEKD